MKSISSRSYMLMKYVPGQNLEDLLKEQPDQCFSLLLSMAIIAPIVDALTYLHQQIPAISDNFAVSRIHGVILELSSSIKTTFLTQLRHFQAEGG